MRGVLLKLTATAGSDDADIAFVPIPRIEMLYMLKLALEKLIFGTARSSSAPPSILCSSSAADDSAVNPVGPSLHFPSRFGAVQTSSLGVWVSAAAHWAFPGA